MSSQSVSVIPYDPLVQKALSERLNRENAKTGSIRISLMWYNINDLDLSVVAPSGEKIWFHNKTSKCGGFLDVDMNSHGESLEPIENIFWPAGKAPLGRYQVFVENFNFFVGGPLLQTLVTNDKGSWHAGSGKITYKTPFIVEVSINDKSRLFKGVISGRGPESRQRICSFNVKKVYPNDRFLQNTGR